MTEARQLFSDFTNVKIETPLGHADLLDYNVGQRHRGIILNIAKNLLPRWFIRRFFPSSGIFMLIEARK